jgi:hypothetical protein
MVRALLRAMEKGHISYGQNPTAAIALIQKVQRVDDRAVAKQIYDDDMLRHNPGGQLEEPSMKRVIERAKEMLKVQRNVELNEVFDLSLAREAEADLKKTKWEP